MANVLLVIPAFRESKRLPSFLEELCPIIDASKHSIDLLIVDDGSPLKEYQQTREAVKPYQKDYQWFQPVLRLESNQGKGAAVRAGWDTSQEHSWLAFVDADGSITPHEINRLINLVHTENEERAYFASRIKMLGREVIRQKRRHYSGRFFATLVGIFITDQVYDSQCGFKLLPNGFYHSIKPLLEENRWAFDVEILAALQFKKLPILEVPVDWHEVSGGKIRLLRDSWDMFRSVLRIANRRKAWLKNV